MRRCIVLSLVLPGCFSPTPLRPTPGELGSSGANESDEGAWSPVSDSDPAGADDDGPPGMSSTTGPYGTSGAIGSSSDAAGDDGLAEGTTGELTIVDALPLVAGFEPGDPPPSWIDTIESSANVSPAQGASIPECHPVASPSPTHAGDHALLFSGHDDSATQSSINFQVYEASIEVEADTHLRYALFPNDLAAAFTTVDLVFTDDTALRDSGAVDTSGCSVHPAGGHCGAASPGIWLEVDVNLGATHAGRTIERIIVIYDRPELTGEFRGYVDDIYIGG